MTILTRVSVAVLLFVSGAATSGCTSGQDSARCPAPSSDAVVKALSDTESVVRVRVGQRVSLTDGVTDTYGWLVDPLYTYKGDFLPGKRFAVWPATATREVLDGEFVMFLRPHGQPTLANGESSAAYDLGGGTGALLEFRDGHVATVCRESSSAFVDDSVLDGIG